MKTLLTILIFVVFILTVYHLSETETDKKAFVEYRPVIKQESSERCERLEYKIDVLERELARAKNINTQFEQRFRELHEDYVIQTDDRGVETVRFRSMTRSDIAGDPVSEPLVQSLMGQGVTEDVAAEVFQRIGEKKMDILELRDQAVREGWADSDDYQEQLSKLAFDPDDIRDEFGDEVFDRYLYATGQTNRLVIEDIYPDSQAEYSELKPGDIITGYADESVFSTRDLRVATTEGVRDETVVVDILRDGEPLKIPISRGPLGIKIEPIVLEPGRVEN